MVRETATRHLSQSCTKLVPRPPTQHDTPNGKGFAPTRIIYLRCKGLNWKCCWQTNIGLPTWRAYNTRHSNKPHWQTEHKKKKRDTDKTPHATNQTRHPLSRMRGRGGNLKVGYGKPIPLHRMASTQNVCSLSMATTRSEGHRIALESNCSACWWKTRQTRFVFFLH